VQQSHFKAVLGIQDVFPGSSIPIFSIPNPGSNNKKVIYLAFIYQFGKKIGKFPLRLFTILMRQFRILGRIKITAPVFLSKAKKPLPSIPQSERCILLTNPDLGS
jgi:hypothetical protein